MTSERTKSILILAVTLVVGMLLGLLVPGLFNKWEKRGGRGENRGREQDPGRKKEWFVGTMNRMLRPDSLQAKKIQPIMAWAAGEVDSLENTANRRMTLILDSVKIQLKPFLTPDQQARLNNFDANARKAWIRSGKRRR